VNVLVTGAEGFVGRVIAEGSSARGDTVRAFVAMGAPSVIRARFERAGISVIEARRDDEAEIERAARGVDVAIHAAPDQRMRGPMSRHEKETLIPAEATLASVQRAGVGRLVLVSSEAVTAGNTARGYVDEALPHASQHVSAFAECMSLAEALVSAASGQKGVETVIVRPGLVWGPDDDEYLPMWIRAAKARTLSLVGDGAALFPTTLTANLVQGVRHAAIASIAAGRTYHLTDDERITPKQFLTKLLVALGLSAPRRRVPYAVAYAAAWFAERTGNDEPDMSRAEVVRFGRVAQFNLQRAREELQYEPMRIDAGMKALAAWAQKAGGPDVIARGEVADLSSVVEPAAPSEKPNAPASEPRLSGEVVKGSGEGDG
jgi:sterol-4alpha-carboxylate 3-dehydrogenase (decarboxylating)